MSQVIQQTYFVGPSQEYKTPNAALRVISAALQSGDFVLPDGDITVLLVEGSLYPPIKLPDDTTGILYEQGKRLIIKRQEFTQDNQPILSNMPIISPEAPEAKDLEDTSRYIGIDIGENNPGITITGLRVEKFLIGISAGFNCHDLQVDKNILSNNINTGIYVHDIDKATVVNNLCIGGEYGVVLRLCKRIRLYHNTVFLDGTSALSGKTFAGIMVQGQRLFNDDDVTFAYVMGNNVFTINCPAAIYYTTDLTQRRLLANYNNYYAIDSPLVQMRQDAAVIGDEDEPIDAEFFSIKLWKEAGQNGTFLDFNGNPIGVDADSISVHPVFINNIDTEQFQTSIVDLSIFASSPLLEKVPSWYNDLTPPIQEVPSDFDTSLISKDILLNNREAPFTAIGSNDAPSFNGFFGQDVLTAPIEISTTKKCEIDPFSGLVKQAVNMTFPKINSGYFYSYERKYYLYGKKGASQLGFMARLVFKLPAILDVKENISVRVRGEDVPEKDWDISGTELTVYTRTIGISSFEDEVEIEGKMRWWGDSGFLTEDVFYVYKVIDSRYAIVLPDTFVATAPVVITDDRIHYRDHEEICRKNFKVNFNEKRQESEIDFLHTWNHIRNPQFDNTSNGVGPANWSPVSGDIRLVDTDWAHMGSKALALRNRSQIVSEKFPVFSGDSLAVSWHGMLPSYTLSDDATYIDSLSATVHVKFYDNRDNLIGTNSDEFTMEPGKYRRYYSMYAPNNVEIPENITDPVVDIYEIGGTSRQFPVNCEYATLSFEAPLMTGLTDEAFFAIDAVQVEDSQYPTPYHMNPDFRHMTAEYETSEEGIFIDKRMNLTPSFNENPNGFLYITDMPAKIWGGPDNLETTTLHEYRWPEGRILHLPWARLWGKDKLTQMQFETEDHILPRSIIEPFHPPKRAQSAFMEPTTLRARQGSTDTESFSIQVIDDVGNPFGIRNYTLSVLEKNDHYPGSLVKRKLGAKEQLGTTIFGKLNENGAITSYYIPPDDSLIKWVGDVPKPLESDSNISDTLDTISYINTNYDVSLENNGNITVIGASGFISTEGTTPITGNYSIESAQSDGSFISLQYPPVAGSVEVSTSETNFLETYGSPKNGEYFVDYGNAQLIFYENIPTDIPVKVSYLPKYAYPNPSDQNTIIFHHNYVFENERGPIQVDYDAQIYVEINVQQAFSGEFVNVFPVVVQNPQLGNFTENTLSLEY